MLSKNQLGFFYMFISVCAFSLMDVIVKWSDEYPVGQVLFFRGFFGIIFYFFVIPKDRLHNFYQTKRPGLHALRCLSGLIALVAIFIALRKLIFIIFFFNSIFLLRIFLYIFTSEMYFSIHPLVDVFFFKFSSFLKNLKKKIHPLVNVLENTSHHEDV